MSTALSVSDGRYSVTFSAVGDELHAGADRRRRWRRYFAASALFDLDAPVDAGQRQAVVDVAHVGPRARESPATFFAAAGQQRPDRARRAGPGSACRSAGRRAAP